MNETDLDLERRLRSHFRDTRATVAAPSTLREAVLTIPSTEAAPGNRWWANRRGVTLLAATVAIGAAAMSWLALGGGRPPSPPPSMPAILLEASPTASPQRSEGPDRSATPSDRPAVVPPAVVPPQVVADGVAVGWIPAGTMAQARSLATATVLQDGRVLVVAGFSRDTGDTGLASAELWDPATRAFTPAGSLDRPRIGHAAALLNDGRVLIVGGEDLRIGHQLPAEVWDPASGSFQEIGSMPALRSGLTATTLLDGRVLIVGRDACLVPQRKDDIGLTRCPGASASTVLWDPSGTWQVGPSPLEERQWHTATRLQDGRVLLVGNESWSLDSPESAEVYDPATDAFTRVGEPLDYISGSQTATLLQDGRVLITGGDTSDPNGDPRYVGPLRTAETWDPATGQFSRAGTMDIGRRAHQAVLLPDGRVLVVGGSTERTATFHDPGTATTEIWDPATNAFTAGPELAGPRAQPALVALPDGVLVIGGDADYNARAGLGKPLRTAELLDFSSTP